MYTSGSTGTPKGVVVPHHAISRLAINNGYAQITSSDCIAHYSNPAFDASTFEVWGALLCGASVLVIPQSLVLEASEFAEILTRHGVTMLYMSVGLFNQCIDSLAGVFPKLRYLLVGGEALEPNAIRRVLRDSRPQHLLNAYGPTECTTFATTHAIESVAASATSIPIGRPIANGRIYVLDRHGEPVPIGVTGELYIGGAGVARGYLNRPELTAERFMADPFSGEAQARMYRSGDLGRWRADGTIEYLGRNDQQVKLRGFRIELGEIEAQLMSREQVQDAAVIAREDVPGEKRLVAYVVLRAGGGSEEAVAGIRGHLKTVLPEYMVPSALVVLERLPLTQNGKLDRRALPMPEMSGDSTRYQAPQGQVEETLAQIWQDLLQIERVGRDDNFFELGGHSLHGVKLAASVTERLGIGLSVVAVFQYPTIQSMASFLGSQQAKHGTDACLEDMEFDEGVL
jgi:acyl-coenzyme A synthetase/AMP-(fatty) acid ligase/acyl carrier protein